MEGFWSAVDDLSGKIARSKAVNVNSAALRVDAAALAQRWFREFRPEAAGLGMSDLELASLDADLQSILRLSNSPTKKASYVKVLRSIRQRRPELQSRLNTLQGQAALARAGSQITPLEAGVIATLEQMLPHAALSYRQVLADLSGSARFSYRGTATELREVVREVLDHLAPDESVLQSPGFKLEKDRKGPTMKQKARFILKARGVGETSRTAPEQSVDLLEDQTASLARSVYERGSASTHASTVRSQVLSFKAYADAVLAELLQLHATVARIGA